MAQVISFPVHRILGRQRPSAGMFAEYLRVERTRQRWDYALAGSLVALAALSVLF